MQRYTSISHLTPREPLPLRLSASRAAVRFRAGDKWLLAGTSGCGKTTAAKHLMWKMLSLLPASHLYALDSKFAGDFDDWPGRVQTDFCPPPLQGSDRIQVWQPIHLIPEEIEKWLAGIKADKPAILYIDEVVHLKYPRIGYSPMYEELNKVGRALPVMVITGTQELRQVPSPMITQSNHRLGFYIETGYDRVRLKQLLKAPYREPPDTWGFWYQHQNGRGEPQYFASIQDFLE